MPVSVPEPTQMPSTREPRQEPGFTRRVLIVVGIGAAAIVVAGILWYAADVLLLAFAGLLLAVLLNGVAQWLADHTPLRYGWALALAVVSLLTLLGLGIWLLAATLVDQVLQLIEQFPEMLSRFRQQLEQTFLGQQILAQAPQPDGSGAAPTNLLSTAAGFFSSSLGALFDVAIIFFVGVYLAAKPALYLDGVVRLVPKARRARFRDVLLTVGYTLRWWLIGQLITMTIVGSLTTVGLLVLGVPFAPVLGLLAALCEFVPNVGPVLAAVPGVLLAVTESPTLALITAGLYIVIQTIESYVVYPLVQSRAVELPPALTIIALVLLSVLLGGMGLLLATPMTAALLVLIKLLYVEDVLGDDLDVAGEPGG